jgi:hypothetical protein
VEPDKSQLIRVASILALDSNASAVLDLVAGLGAPDAWLVAGAIMGTVFNALTGRPSGYGITDWDIAYCDPSDLSEEQEMVVARQAGVLAQRIGLDLVELEVVNQARVHRWYPARFGRSCPAYRSTAEAVARYQAFCSCVGARRREPRGAIEMIAPHGLGDLLAFRVRPNRIQAPREVYEAKAERWRAAWPELAINTWGA